MYAHLLQIALILKVKLNLRIKTGLGAEGERRRDIPTLLEADKIIPHTTQKRKNIKIFFIS